MIIKIVKSIFSFIFFPRPENIVDPDFIFPVIVVPAPIILLLLIIDFGKQTAFAPIKTLSFIFTPPKILAPGAIKQFLPIETSWPIDENECIIVCDPIDTFVPIKTLLKTQTPLPIF